MFEQEKERGIKLARLSRQQKDEMTARLMFGKDWQGAREAMLMLMHAWGIGTTGAPEAKGMTDHE